MINEIFTYMGLYDNFERENIFLFLSDISKYWVEQAKSKILAYPNVSKGEKKTS